MRICKTGRGGDYGDFDATPGQGNKGQSPALVGAKIRRGWVWSMLFAYDSVTVSLTSVVQILKS